MNLKDEAQDSALSMTRCSRSYGLVARHDAINEQMNDRLFTKSVREQDNNSMKGKKNR